MKRGCWLSLCLVGFAAGGEFPRPSERLRALPADDWLPARQRATWSFAFERPIPQLPLTLSECVLRQPLRNWLSSEVWFWSLDSELIVSRAAGAGATLLLPGCAFSARARQEWTVLDAGVEAQRRRVDLAVAWGDGPWRAGLRARWRESLWLDATLQLRGAALALALEREASPFGGEDAWVLGCQTKLAPAFWLGVQARARSADLQLSARRAKMRLRLACAASGPDRGGFAIATEWLR
jgi:hypothetical protein